MVFVADPEAAARWWGEIFEAEVRLDINGTAVYAWLDLDGLEFGFHQASPKANAHGRSTVPYWSVEDFDHFGREVGVEADNRRAAPLIVGYLAAATDHDADGPDLQCLLHALPLVRGTLSSAGRHPSNSCIGSRAAREERRPCWPSGRRCCLRSTH
ncbi:VOC family protein [Streptomyces sp. NPDC003691]